MHRILYRGRNLVLPLALFTVFALGAACSAAAPVTSTLASNDGVIVPPQTNNSSVVAEPLTNQARASDLSLQAATGAGSDGAEQIAVSGRASKFVPPNIATINGIIEVRASSVASAVSQLNTRVNSVINALKASGLTEDDIRSPGFSIREDASYDYQTGERTRNGFIVSQSVIATVRDIDNTSSILDELVRVGDDLLRLNDVRFSVENVADIEDELRTEAIRDAKRKAEVYATALGITVGRPLLIYEGGQVYINNNVTVRALSEDFANASASAPSIIVSGDIQLNISVGVSFAIE